MDPTDAMDVLGASPGGGLHPLIPTSSLRPNEVSVDTGVDHQCHGFDEDMGVARVFGVVGIDAQGPAGVPVPERVPLAQPFEQEEADSKYGYIDSTGEAPPDSAGPVDPLEIQMGDYTASGGMEEAGAAALQARREGKGDLEVLDALEVAERAYEASHQEQPAAVAAAAAAAAAAHGAAAAGGGIGSATRQRVIDAISSSLAANPAFVAQHGEGAEPEAARRCEEALFGGGHSKTVYLSLASNAVRVARTVADVGDLPRIASGEPRADPSAPDTTPYVTGLQGYVIKPDYL